MLTLQTLTGESNPRRLRAGQEIYNYTFVLRAGTLIIYTSSELLVLWALQCSGLRCQNIPVQPAGVPGSRPRLASVK